MNSKLALLASLSLASLYPADSSDACGVYEPTVFRLTSTWNRGGGSRTFALTNGKVTGTPDWKQIAPMTYDYTSVAAAPRLAQPMTITLLGKSGTKVTSTRSQVFIQHSFVQREATTALELQVGRGEFSFALAGSHEGARWMSLDSRQQKPEDVSWVKAQHLEAVDSQYVSVDTIEGTELETISVLTKDKYITLVRDHGNLRAQFEGYPMGAFTLRGIKYIVATSADRGTTWAEPVY